MVSLVCEELPLTDDGHLSLSSGETVYRNGDSLIVKFSGPRDVLSTSWLNGGYRRDIVAVFNHQIPLPDCDECHANGGVSAYLSGVAASRLHIPARGCGLITRADMRNAVVVTARYCELTVTAVVTGGIDKNGVRAGDPASYSETDGQFEPVPGTINTILLMKADLPEYALTRAIITATEAKVAALQQLMARSIYSAGIATGSGTDMIAVIANPDAPLHLTDAGTHSLLGELIATTIIRATTRALERETGLSSNSQYDVMVRLSRFGITADHLHRAVIHLATGKTQLISRDTFTHFLKKWSGEPVCVGRIAAALHLLDETAWGLLPKDAACDTLILIFGGCRTSFTEKSDEPRDCLITLVAMDILQGFANTRRSDGIDPPFCSVLKE